MAKEKKVTKQELTKMIRIMIKEAMINKDKKPSVKTPTKLSVPQLTEMIRESITEVLEEETETLIEARKNPWEVVAKTLAAAVRSYLAARERGSFGPEDIMDQRRAKEAMLKALQDVDELEKR